MLKEAAYHFFTAVSQMQIGEVAVTAKSDNIFH
jgi:hypothetical protein